jgi:hypothetical protein
MKIAYLINAHKNFKQLERLVAKLNQEQDGIYFIIHIDKKVDAENYAIILASLKKYNATFVANRVDVKWGEFTQVEATINGLNTILSSGNRYDYINFISGQDYPIKHNNFIIRFLSHNKGYEYMECYEVSPNGWAGAMVRFERYWLNGIIKNEHIRSLIQNYLTILLPKRKIPLGYRAYGGSQWWTISSDCASYILNFINKNKEYVDFFKLTQCPDEMFFQTIIMNSTYKSSIYKHNLRYADWSERKSNPKVLVKDDFSLLKSSDKLFARKFDSNIDEDILDMIDNYTEFNST